VGLPVLRWVRANDGAPPHPLHPVFVGFIGIAAIVAIWNYFFPARSGVQWTVVAFAAISIVHHRRMLGDWMTHWWARWKALGWPARTAWAIVFLITLVKSFSPSESPDDGFYRVPYVQWIEQFRLTPGIANLEDRFAFNSSAHLVSAFSAGLGLLPYGFGVNGLLMVVFAGFAIGGLDRCIKGSRSVADTVAAFGLFFLFRNMLGSISADIPNILMGQTLLVLALRKVGSGNATHADRDLLLIALYAVFLPTLKLSSLFLLLVPLWFLWRIRCAGVRPAMGGIVVLALVVGLPWLGRFGLLSGYVVFPIHTIDVLEVDWKVPEILVRQQFHYVSGFAKVNAKPWESEAVQATGLRWVPTWFARENMLNKLVALAVAGLLVMGTALLLARGRRLWREQRDLLVLAVILALNIVIWFVRYPAFRFGWAWVVAFLAMGVHHVLHGMGPRVGRLGVVTLLFASLLQGAIMTGREARSLPANALVRPTHLDEAPFREVQLGNVTVRVPLQFYCTTVPPPCLPPLGKAGSKHAASGRRTASGSGRNT
jgi:hypothetical protein